MNMKASPFPGCEECGLWENSGRPLEAEVVRADAEGRVGVLFVGGFPNRVDDEEGWPFSGNAGRFLRECLEPFKGTYAFATGLRCRTGLDFSGAHKPPTDKQIKACNPHLLRIVEDLDPKVVVAMGGVALRALWPKAPKSVASARTAPVRLGERYLFVAYDPSNHVSGRMDLREDYYGLLTAIAQTLEGTRPRYDPVIRTATREDLPRIHRQVMLRQKIYIDVEFDTVNSKKRPAWRTFWMRGRQLLCLGVGTSPGEPVWVIPGRLVGRELLDLLATKTLVAHNIVTDVGALAYMADAPHLWDADLHCTFLLHTSYDQGYLGNSLESLCMKYLQVPSWKHLGWGRVDEEEARRRSLPAGDPLKGVPVTLGDIEWPSLADYNGHDVFYDMPLDDFLVSNRGVPPVYTDHLIPVARLLGKVAHRGIGANARRLRAIRAAVEEKIEALSRSLERAPEIARIMEAKGGEFNPRSTLHKIMLLELTGIEVLERTSKTGAPSTGKRVLEAAASEQTIWRRVKAVHDHQNLVSKFLEPLAYHLDTRDGRVHTSYILGKSDTLHAMGSDPVGGTVSGRIASRDPALHNLKKDRILRSIFEAPPGYVLVEFDFGQVEVRGMAQLAGSDRLREIFVQGRDCYIETAAQLYRKDYAAVTKAERQRCKQGFLSKIYRIGLDRFCANLGIGRSEGQAFFDEFDRLFPEIPRYQERLLAEARRGEPQVTLFGRTRLYRFTGDPKRDSHEENSCCNMPVQSACSDITLVYAMRTEAHWPHDVARIVNTVHDSLWMEVREDMVETVVEGQSRLMTDLSILPVPFDVPLAVSVAVGRNLGDMRER